MRDMSLVLTRDMFLSVFTRNLMEAPGSRTASCTIRKASRRGIFRSKRSMFLKDGVFCSLGYLGLPGAS